MNLVALGLGLLVSGVLAVYLVWPWRAQPSGDAKEEAEDDGYEAVLTALRDLDFDHALGKVADEDYGPLRQDLLAKAAGIMAQRDAQVQDGSEMRAPARDGRACPACGWILRPGGLFCAGCGIELSSAEPPCPWCGRVAEHGDLFCRNCGAQFTPTAVQSRLEGALEARA